MNEVETAKQYVDAWNAHDPVAVAAVFAEGANYSDPMQQGIAKEVLPDSVRDSITAFPDLSFEVTNIISSGDGHVALEWVMRGTNTGSFFGSEPTGRFITIPGVDVIQATKSGKINSLRSYYSENAFAKQLGLA